MCGIVGYITLRLPPEERIDVVRRIGLLQYHRGPDFWGEFSDDFVSLGHNRLSILDLLGGNQPMRDSTGRLIVVYNGEIYNYLELKVSLFLVGIVFELKIQIPR